MTPYLKTWRVLVKFIDESHHRLSGMAFRCWLARHFAERKRNWLDSHFFGNNWTKNSRWDAALKTNYWRHYWITKNELTILQKECVVIQPDFDKKRWMASLTTLIDDFKQTENLSKEITFENSNKNYVTHTTYQEKNGKHFP